jgi:hypothetical protein
VKTSIAPVIFAILVAGCSSTHAFRAHTPLIEKVADLKPNTDRRITIVGRYHDPGKGERVLDCGFVTLSIGDYSLYAKKADGELVPLVREGEVIEVSAILKFHAGGVTSIEESGMIQTNAPIVTKAGKKFFVSRPGYYVVEVEIVEKRQSKQPNQSAQTTPGLRPSLSDL